MGHAAVCLAEAALQDAGHILNHTYATLQTLDYTVTTQNMYWCISSSGWMTA